MLPKMPLLSNFRRNVTLVVSCILLSPVVYWYVTEPYATQVFYTHEELPAGSKDEGAQNGDKCQFPDFDPFHPYAMKYFQRYPTISCPDGMPTITYYTGTEVKVNQTKKRHTFGNQHLTCWFRDVTFQTKIDFVNGPWQGPFVDSITVKGRPEFVEVKCQNSEKTIVSRMQHYITRKEERMTSLPPKHEKTFKPQSMNVIMLCVDSMARHLFTRAMPKTRQYLLETLGSVELKKYNKVGSNTFPNLMAIITGKLPQEQEEWTKAQAMDGLPFLWRDYKAAGYKTQYMTDRPDFNSFRIPPTDCFNTPIARSLMQGKISFNNNCFEDNIEVPLWLDLVLEFARDSLFTTGRFFSFGMMNRPTHDFPNEASAVDEHYYNFFKELNDTGLLNNTLVVFYGDHGPRMSDYRRTFYGSIEERAALMTIYVPEWFREKYPVHYNNLKYNSRRLTTNFDVHETVRNLLLLETGGDLVTQYNDDVGKAAAAKTNTNSKSSYVIKRSKTGKQRAFSLFSKVPQDRTCPDADIAPHFCLCHGGVAVTEPAIMEELGHQVVRDLNKFLEPKSDLCVELSLKSVNSLSLQSGRVGRSALYRVIFSTAPSGAVFEATVEYSVRLYFFKTIRTLGFPSRLDLYQGQSDCVSDDRTLKTMCYCKDVFLSKHSSSSNVTTSSSNL